MKRFKKPEDIKVGVCGYGGAFNMGRKHLQEMQKAGMAPVAVAEIDPARLDVAKQDFPGIETYSSLSEMLKKSGVNLITIITPHNTHAKLAIQCLKAGRHVVCEKPLAITTAECDRMIAAAKKSRVVLSTYHNRHWDGCILRAAKEIKSGIIGDVVRISNRMGGWRQPKDWWRSSKSISGGILYDWGVHLLEYSLQIVDSKIVEVAGFLKNGFWADKTRWGKDTTEDEGCAVVRFHDGKWLTLCITSIDSNVTPGRTEITGTQGTYIMDQNKWKTIIQKNGEKMVEEGVNPPGESWRYYQNMADHLVKSEKLVITPEWSRRPIHILDLACKSAQKGRSLMAKYH